MCAHNTRSKKFLFSHILFAINQNSWFQCKDISLSYIIDGMEKQPYGVAS